MAGSLPWPAEPLPRRSRIAVALVGLVLASALVFAGAWAALRPNAYAPSRDGCVNVVAAVSTGGSLMHQCGALAQQWCAAELGVDNVYAHTVEAQCRLAGIEP
ncbi:MAG: hypothetical protein ACRDY2_12405 [Acidimicrobiales bacterium]